MTDIVTVYHIYPEGCCDEYRYSISNKIGYIDIKGISIVHQQRSAETKQYETKDSISFTIDEAVLVHKLLGKLIAGDS